MPTRYRRREPKKRVSPNTHFLNGLQAIRKEKGLTQEALCKLVGIPEDQRGQISNYENGKKECRIDRARKIADKLDVSVDDLISGKDKKPNGKSTEAKKIDYMAFHRDTIREQFKFEPPLDVEQKNRKNLIGFDRENPDPYWRTLQEYLTECWELKKRLPDHPELPRHYIRIFLCAVKPELTTDEIELVVSHPSQELWTRIIQMLPSTSPGNPTIPQATDELLSDAKPWAQIAVVRLFREVAVSFRNRLKFDEDWEFAKRAFELYLLCECQSSDPEEHLLYDLVIGVVHSAANSLKTSELSKIDESDNLLFKYLHKRFRDYGTRGERNVLGAYYASCGEISKAKSIFQGAIKKFEEGGEVLKTDFIDTLIFLGCCETEKEREKTFLRLFSERDWIVYAKAANHHLFSMVSVALMYPKKPWPCVLDEVKRQGLINSLRLI